MSFPWDGHYAVILLNWPVPDGVLACAGEPLSERERATALDQFDSVQFISTAEYELMPPPGPERTLLHMPDAQQVRGVVHQLRARSAALDTLLTSAVPSKR